MEKQPFSINSKYLLLMPWTVTSAHNQNSFPRRKGLCPVNLLICKKTQVEWPNFQNDPMSKMSHRPHMACFVRWPKKEKTNSQRLCKWLIHVSFLINSLKNEAKACLLNCILLTCQIPICYIMSCMTDGMDV